MMGVDDAPDVDIRALVAVKAANEATRFERETHQDTKQNHVTGFLQEAQLDRARFNEQRVRFDNTGFTMNPTDGAGITSSMFIGKDRTLEE